MTNLLSALMKPTDYRHYQIFHTISGLTPGLHSVAEVAELFTLSESKMLSRLMAVQRDLMILNVNQQKIMVSNSVFDTTKLLIKPEEYRIYLVHKAIPIAVLRYALTDSHPELANCCGYYKISRATFYRQFALMDQYLESFDIGLNKSSMQFTGNEQQIRMVLFAIFKLGAGKSDWPQEPINSAISKHLLHQYHYSEISIKEVKLILNINYWRANYKHPLPANTNIDLLCTDNSDYDQSALTQLIQRELPTSSTVSAEREAAFSYFIVTIIPRYQDDHDPRLIHNLGYFARKHNLAWQFTERLLNFLEKQFASHSEIILPQLTIGNILNANLTTLVMQEPAIDLLNYQELLEHEPIYLGLSQSLTKFFEQIPVGEYAVFQEHQSQLLTYYYALLLPTYLLQVKRPALRIGLIFEGSQLSYGRIAQALRGVCEVHIHPYNEKTAKLDDLVVTTTAFVTAPRGAFYLPIDYTQVQLENLQLKIYRLCYQRLTQRTNI